jgi:PIN domain nuclease of toxin-antitoxin system
VSYLLDTHSYLWWLAQPARLGRDARAALEDRSASVFVSVASFWEIAIKTSLGKLNLSRGIEQLESELAEDGLLLLSIQVHHCGGVMRLPFHHRDPFDRLLVAQALIEGLSLLSRDSQLDAYGVTRVW